MPSSIHAAAVAATVAAILACGGAPPSTSEQPGAGPDAAPRTGEDADSRTEAGSHLDQRRESEPAPADATTRAAVGEAECQALLDHMIDLARAEHAAGLEPEARPTDEQVRAIRAKLAPEFLKTCSALDRATYECERAATTLAAMMKCSPPSAAPATGSPGSDSDRGATGTAQP
ncbi:MAG: hypothetical protein AAGC55_11665 [Myxococcota bacterium]